MNVVGDHEARDPDVELAFEPDSSAAQMARRALQPLIGDEGDPIAPAVEAVTSELVTNVVLHTSGAGTVRAWDPKPNVPFHLEVADEDSTLPHEREAPDELGGFGLRIVEEMSDDWGVELSADGKTVWAEFSRPE